MTDTKTTDLTQVNTLQLAAELNNRYNKAYTYVISAAATYTPGKRQLIAEHIREDLKEAREDLKYGVIALHRSLETDFWDELKEPTQPGEQVSWKQTYLTDFAVMMATMATQPAYRKHVATILNAIDPAGKNLKTQQIQR